MTTTVEPAQDVQGETSLAPGARSRWRSVRVPVLAGVALLSVSVGLAVLAGRGTSGSLDPEAYDQAGSRAAAELLRDAGVRVHVARTVAQARAAAPGATLLVTQPVLVPAETLGSLAAAAAGVVLISPGPQTLAAVGAGLIPVGGEDVKRRSPQCSLPAAVRAGDVDLGGIGYAVTPGASPSDPVSLCYPSDAGASLARRGRVTVLGAGDPLTNERIDERGNAALVLAVLGERDDLVWYRPAIEDPALHEGGSKPLHVLLPRSIKVAMLQLGVAMLVIAAWRGRRLGPVVGEPLPVVVRASEATEGLARLYRRAGARHRAAAALREAAVRSIAPRFGLPTVGADQRQVAEAVARHTGATPLEVAALLYGDAPVDDVALVALADDLDILTAQLRGGRPHE